MKTLHKLMLGCALVIAVTQTATSQIRPYTVANAHSHNDYKNSIPFYRAYEKGFGSIEADVYAVGGKLMVAHSKSEISADRSLQALYLDPLAEKLKNAPKRQLRLLIEIKENYKAVLPLVIEEMKPFAGYISSPGHPGRLSIVMTGAVPPATEMPNYPDWITFDVDHLDGFTPQQWQKIGLVSFPLGRYVRWNGKGVLNKEEIKRVKGAIDSVHQAGKMIRFWESPDTKSSWLALMRLGVDVIGTDKIEEMGDFLNGKARGEYLQPKAYAIYQPTYKSDGATKKVKNIILCIGDGMGLAQLYATYTANQGKLNIFGMRNIGFSVTNAADAYITDSAAGATAFATGQKTNDRAVGVDVNGKPLQSLATYSAAAGKKTAIIVVCPLTDATPAALYGHRQERSESTQIATDIINSNADIFLGAGYSDFTTKVNGVTVTDLMQQRGYSVIRKFDDFLNSYAKKILALVDDSTTRSKISGRGDYLPLAFKKVTAAFKNHPNGFFIMTEGSQIDYGGHENNLAQVITENADFDRMVGEALRFADLDGETLVIVTADHETGGLTLLDGDIKKGYVLGNFSTNDHTGTPVPVFAYGPHSGDFRGVYSNTQIFDKLLKLMKK
ncbi:alkaline phosphatase [Mucilaginibacter psychrotolerans]|uniref:Alkaline phosphatase n=1 Tax=Mucilaginibacter psychrotolerans TaxID=1524096 RepID=A0A4Y8SMG2_9SPHI|nr:alkaline phosphatase [Mucilaginibacter psychrotolerans]TFF39727.1 alkaline phosphatase [Mucilaginibacter psychrotolerans]